MRRGPILFAFLLVLSSPGLRAYEGAGAVTEEAPPAPPAPVLTRPPEVALFVEADYPPALLASGKGGDVILVIDIAADGTVPLVDVKQSSGEPLLDEAAKAALLNFRFIPAEFDHKPGPVRLEYQYRFESRPPPPAPVAVDAPKPVNLKGRVLERGTREPLPGATVYLPGPELVAETNAAGEFEIRGAPLGLAKVEVSEVRHRKFSTQEELREGEVTELTVYLWKRIESGFESTVRGAREKKEVSRRTLEQAELKSVPGTFGDPLRVLQNLPGMARAPFVSGALLVRGAQPEDTGVYIDGLPIPLLYHFGGGPSVVNPSFISSIDFYPGAYGSRYGRAIAGIVDVSTRGPEAKAIHGNFDIDFLDAGAFLEGPVTIGGNTYGHWAVAGRRSYVDTFLPTLLEAAQGPGQATIVAAPRYWDYQARYDVELARNKLELTVFGSDDTLNVAQAGTAETQGFSLNQHQGFHRARVRWSRRFADGLSVSVAPAIGSSVTAFNLGDDLKVDVSNVTFHGRAAVNKEFSKRLSFEAGIDVNVYAFTADLKVPEAPQYQPFPGENPQTPTVARKVEQTGHAQAAYFEAVWNPWRGLKLVPGLRYEYYTLAKVEVGSLEPRIAARYEFNDATAVKLAWGRFRQNPEPFDLDRDYGNPYLGLAESSQWVGGFERRLFAKLSLDVQLFYNWRRELVINSNRVIEQDGERVRENKRNGGRGQAYGLEVLLKQDLTERMYGWVAYTLSRSEQRNDLTGLYLPVSYDQSHILTVVASYKFDSGWETGLRFRLTSGRPTTPTLDATYDADRNSYRPVQGIAGSVRGSTFHQLDLRAEKLWTFEQWKLSTYLDIQNVYNAENPEIYLNDYRYLYTATVRGLPFLPTLGVTGAF